MIKYVEQQPPSIRNESLYWRFFGAVETRLASGQNKIRSYFLKPLITEKTIVRVWPEENMQFFCVWITDNVPFNTRLDDLTFVELAAVHFHLSTTLNYDIT